MVSDGALSLSQGRTGKLEWQTALTFLGISPSDLENMGSNTIKVVSQLLLYFFVPVSCTL
jgi:hypothetical protein